jgi:hypothetical protein
MITALHPQSLVTRHQSLRTGESMTVVFSNVVRTRRVRKDGTPNMRAWCPVPPAFLDSPVLIP